MFESLLKSCPFCGGKAKILTANSKTGSFTRIYCKKCGANFVQTSSLNYNVVDECIKAWNNRVANIQEEKHGKWIYNPNGTDWNIGAYECSLCHSVNHNLPCNTNINPLNFVGSKFCPTCGAKMDIGRKF